MNGRRRSIRKRGLPVNLYERRGYFWWRNPVDGKTHGLGRDKAMAVQEAIEANLYIAGLETSPRLIDRVKGNGRQSVGDWLDRYVKIIDERDVSKATRDGIGQRLTVVRKEWGEACITQISTRDVADFLLKWDAAGKKRMAQAMRSLLLDMFREAVGAGWIDRNPVEPTRAPRVQVTRARLTLEVYQAIHAIALRDYPAWLARAMELALVTAQRREDIATMGPRSIHELSANRLNRK